MRSKDLRRRILQNLSRETLDKMHPHLFSFYNSVKLSLAIVRGEQAWQALYLLAEYDYLLPNMAFKTLFNTPQFRMISGSISTAEWDSYSQVISDGGSFSAPLESGDRLTIVFSPWKQSGPYFETGYEARTGWNRTWPHIRFDFDATSGLIESSLWTLMANAVITYDVPYSSVSEAVSDIFRIKEDRLKFKTEQSIHGSVLLPIFASFDSARYDRSEQKLRLVVQVTHHSKVNQEKLYVSARLETRDQRTERVPKTRPTRAAPTDEELCRSEWGSYVELSPALVQRTSFHLVYDLVDDYPLLIDQAYLQSVPALTAKSEIEKLMTEKSDRRRLDYWTKIEKWLLDGKGDEFEEAMFMLLSRAGFDVSWESKNSPFDILAASPNGCLVVECTSDPPSVAMAEELKSSAQLYRSQMNPLVLPVLATNQTSSRDLDLDTTRMHQYGEVYFLTRDRLKQLLDTARYESLARTEKYLQRHFVW